MPFTARVVLPLPLDSSYTYEVPGELQNAAQVGCRVLVPFGPRVLTGLIVERTEEEGSFKPVLDVPDAEPALTEEMLRLTRWIAEYYVCSWGEAIRAALPSGTGQESKVYIHPTDHPLNGWSGAPAAREVLAFLEANGPCTLAELQRGVPASVSMYLVRQMEAAGLVSLEQEIAPPRVRVKTEKHVRFAPAFRETAGGQADYPPLRSEQQVALVEALSGLARDGRREPSRAELLALCGASAATLNGLVRKGLLEIVEREVIRTPLSARTRHPAPIRDPHPAQRQALTAIRAAIAENRFKAFLLHGITGSGKTEVYIQALKDVLDSGRTGIVLVPEIALTPQTVERFRAHFGDRIAVLHSRMSPGERYDAWRHLRGGRFSVVIGPRSAVLAPLSNLGLIVVDEEHETSYKQFDPAPRYHARDVAVMRAHMNDAVCLLGSATPSIESYCNAQAGKYTLLSMPVRVPVPGHAAAPLPAIRVVDLTLERKKHQLSGTVSEALAGAIEARLQSREQIILLQNRRGYAPVITCEACGWSPRCRDCSVTLTYHKVRRHLRCHYCGAVQRMPPACPRCGAPDLTQLGTGTQKVEEELGERFPEARILRMDLDTTGRKDAHHRILDQFGRGKADILIGTQMVAKGLDFGRVTLVGVINADTGMLLPDFRAGERTFQLLTQVAGRAGRGALKGEVILQTRNPGHPALRFACRHDYEGFIEAELRDRKPIGYPPFGRLVGVEFRGPGEETVEQMARAWTALLREQTPTLTILGPEAAFVGRVKRLYRFHTVLKAPRTSEPGEIKHLLRRTNDAYGTPPRGYRIAIDVDPVGLF